MIALFGGDVTEARKRFTVVGDACENTVQQTCSIVELTGHEVLLGGGESVFNVVTHGDIGLRKTRSVDGWIRLIVRGCRVSSRMRVWS